MALASDMLPVVSIADFAHLARIVLFSGERSLKLSPGRCLLLLKVLLDGLVILQVDGGIIVDQLLLIVTPRPLSNEQCIASRDPLVVTESGK